MGNPLPRSQSLTWQKLNSGQQHKWDSALSSSNRPSTRASGAAMFGRQLSLVDRVGSSGELTNVGRPRIFYSGEFPRSVGAGCHPSPTPLYVAAAYSATVPSTTSTQDAATNTDDLPQLAQEDSALAIREAFKSGRLRSSVRATRADQSVSRKPVSKEDCPLPEEVNTQEAKCDSDALEASSSGGAMTGKVDPATTSIQTEKEGSHSRLLSQGGESSSLRGRQSSSSSRRESLSFRKEIVSSSFRKEVATPRRRERKGTKSFQDGDLSIFVIILD